MSDYTFNSAFAADIKNLIMCRTAMGYSANNYEAKFYSFDKFCLKHYPNATELSENIVMQWVLKNVEGVNYRASAMRMLATYIISSGRDAYIIPERFFHSSNSKKPYIFSDSELQRLFLELDHYDKTPASVKHARYIVPVYFRLIYTCGLRPQECRTILTKHVNLYEGTIFIEQAKGDKDRYVVLSDDMCRLLKRYMDYRRLWNSNSRYLFCDSDGELLSNQWLNRVFKTAWKKANPNISKTELPSVRIYDLRHRFASCRLTSWIDEKKDLMAMIPCLREYMGHTSISSTAYYVHLLPENLVSNAGIDWSSFNQIIPEVKP